MAELKFDTNLEEIDINGKVTVWLNLSDFGFAIKAAAAIQQMGEIQEKCGETISELTDIGEMFDTFRKADGEIREKIDGLFGMDVCTPLYGSMNVMSYAEGTPVWCNLMFALFDEIYARMDEQQKKTLPRIDKYTAKYMKKK